MGKNSGKSKMALLKTLLSDSKMKKGKILVSQEWYKEHF